MKFRLFALLFFLSGTLCSVAQPAIQWQKSYGGTGDDQEYATVSTADGGYIVAGASISTNGDVTGNHGQDDFWIVKINSTGSLQWQKSFGGSVTDVATAIRQTTDGGYIVAGYSRSIDGDITCNTTGLDYDEWILKLDSSGTLKWQKCLGGTSTDIATDIKQTADGGFIVVGWTQSKDRDVSGYHGTLSTDGWVAKLDSAGSIEWQKCLGGTNDDEASSVQQTYDGGYIVAGFARSTDGDITSNHGNEDCWVIKLSSSGTIEWQKCFGGTDRDYAQAIQQTADSGYIVSGYSKSTDGDVTGYHGGTNYGDYWVFKLSNAGSLEWQKCLGGSGDEKAYAVTQPLSGGYLVAGWSASTDGDVTGNHGNFDYWVVKLTTGGNIAWQKSIGGSGIDIAFTIQATADGGSVVSGASKSNNGNASGNHGGYDYWVVKLDPDQIVIPPVALFQSSDTNFCANACINFTDYSSGNPTSWKWRFPGATPSSSTIKSPKNVCYLSSGAYPVTLIVSNTGGTDSITYSNYIDVKPAPPTPAITQSRDTLFCSYDSAYTSYQWYADSTLIPGATDSFYVAANNGNYNLVVTNDNGCSISTGTNVILGMQHYVNDKLIFLFPNPATNKLYVHVNPSMDTGVLKILNVLGEVCLQYAINNLKSEIDISLLPTGIYFASFTGNEGRCSGRFVKE